MLLKNILQRTNGLIFKRCATRSSSNSATRFPLAPTIPDETLSTFGEPLEYVPLTELPQLNSPMTTLSDPSDHSEEQLGLWYNVRPEELPTVFGGTHFAYPFHFNQLIDTFQSVDFMIRRPSLSVISYIKQLKLDTMTPPKFLFYGRYGSGKTMCLLHVAHYLHKQEYVLLYVPWATRWLKQFLKVPAEIVQSSTVPGRYDHTTDAMTFLKVFRTQNLELINKLGLTLSKDYQLSTREGCSAGSSLIDLADLGISRPRLASDCVYAITQELRMDAIAGRCKVGIVLDGINALLTENSIYKRDEDRSFIHAKDFTLVQAFTDLLKNDWCNGVIVGSVDDKARDKEHRESYMPRYLLGEQGWNTLDPFVAVPVPEYNDLEYESALSYYSSKRWIYRPEAFTQQGKRHLSLLTANNPFEVLKALRGL